MRIGHGYDAHQFKEGDHVVLGGVVIPHNKSLKAHSDGDVMLHALCDALLGAAALGDIGQHFPDTDDEYKGVSSRALLSSVNDLITEKKFRVANIDITIIAQAPKLAPHTNKMKANIAEDLNISVSTINIKATTTEGMGFTGRGEGIAAHAVTLLEEISN